MIIPFGKKFSEKHIDDFIFNIQSIVNSSKKNKITFDLTGTEWISNQNLLLLTSIWKYFIELEVDFKIKIFKDNFSEINQREALNIIQLWDVWKVYQIVPENKTVIDYFNIPNNSSIDILKKNFKIKSNNQLYNRYGITPFITLNKIESFKDYKILKNEISPIYKLNDAVNEIISKNDCEHPFINKTISAIITKELYENFLDHFTTSFFKTQNHWAFLSLSLKSKVLNNNYSIEKNFNEEEIYETKSFFIDNNGSFKNESYIQFSFLDFGDGIVNTLKKEITKGELPSTENEILKYAFKHNTSKHPIYDKYKNIEKLIPRGLFDILSIVKRYEGLIIVRSNHGKIAYDFSNRKDFNQSYLTFGDNKFHFPGTFITIYIPALKNALNYDSTSIKPKIENLNYSTKIPQGYLSLFSIINEISEKNYSKSIIYQKSIETLKKKLIENNKQLFFIDFQGWEIDSRITKVLIFYLASDYDINLNKNIVILNPPDRYFLEVIKNELFDLLNETKSYQTHPLPFIYYNSQKEEVSIFWLGVYNEKDITLLQRLLFKDYEIDLRKTDFEEPENISGNLIEYDNHGNVKSVFPDESRIHKFYKSAKRIFEEEQISELLKHSIDSIEISSKKSNNIFLCSGNYYTKKYLKLDAVLNNLLKTDILSNLLFKKLENKNNDYLYIAVTSSSNKILKSLIRQGLINKNQSIFIENYHKDLSEHEPQKELKLESKYILVCDVIATGYLTNKINEELKKSYKSELSGILVFVNTIDLNFSILNDELSDKLISLKNYPIEKYTKNDLESINQYNIIRVNPFTNQPVKKSLNYINDRSSLLSPEEFIKFFDFNDLTIKFLNFNNEIHPYFFNMESIILKKQDELFSLIFDRIPEKNKQDIDVIFYPQKSAIENLNFDYFKTKILGNQNILDFETERFPTKVGWRFPHLSTFHLNILKGNKVLILDDAACSGDSVLQMIDEFSASEVKEIMILILLARVSDQRAEFLSKLNEIKSSTGKKIPIKIYFGCQWQIGTYSIYNNPILKEGLWLNKLASMKNTPIAIKNIANKINSEIEQVSYLNSPKDYKYFPVFREENKIDKINLFLTRNNIGKIIGFRFYKENFEVFDSILKGNNDYKNPVLNKEIENICSVFLYEPFLFDRVQKLIPDIAEIIRDFLIKIINYDIDLEKDLYYKWDKKDIIHLFFILYKNHSLIDKLKSNGNFLRLLNFSRNSFKRTNPINYLFYKILFYFPLSKDEITNKKNFNDFKFFIEKTINEERTLDKSSLGELKRFYSFINTLPNSNDFKSQLNSIKELYWSHKQSKIHDSQKSLNHNITLFHNGLSLLLTSFEVKEIDDNEIIKIKENWWNIKHDFLDKIISFYRTFNDFFKPYPYHILLNKFDGNNLSLIEMYTYIDDFIFNIKQRGYQKENYLKSIEYIEKINHDFGLGSEFDKIFEVPNVMFQEFKVDFENSFKQKNIKIETNAISNIDFRINIPLFYLKKLIYDEITKNILNYGKENTVVLLSYSIDNEKNVILEVRNQIKDKIVTEFGSREGLNSIIELSNSDFFNFKYYYKVKKDENIFYQNLTFYNS